MRVCSEGQGYVVGSRKALPALIVPVEGVEREKVALTLTRNLTLTLIILVSQESSASSANADDQ